MRRNRDPHLNERVHRVRALQSTLKVSWAHWAHSLKLSWAHWAPARIRLWASGPGGVWFPALL